MKPLKKVVNGKAHRYGKGSITPGWIGDFLPWVAETPQKAGSWDCVKGVPQRFRNEVVYPFYCGFARTPSGKPVILGFHTRHKKRSSLGSTERAGQILSGMDEPVEEEVMTG